MLILNFKLSFLKYLFIGVLASFIAAFTSLAEDNGKSQGPPPVPIQVAEVEKQMVSDQISLVGTAEAVAESIVAAEVSGIVEYFPVKEGDFVKKGELLVRLRSTGLQLRLKGAIATREKIKANLGYAEKELARVGQLKNTDSIAERKYDEAFYNHRALLQEMLQSEAEIERLEYDMKQKKVLAPFSGFVAEEHTQVGEWIKVGGAVVTLVDLEQIRITVDVPERYAVMLSNESEVKVVVKSLSNDPLSGKIHAVLPRGDSDARTFPVKINLANSGFKIKSGMEVTVTFILQGAKSALLVPKDAVVTEGNNKLVYLVSDGKAMPVSVKLLGYYGGHVAVEGALKPGAQVVIRGNERLRPGQAVLILQ